MASRLDLDALLTTILGSSNVYFQPPPSITMSYPCIVYHRTKEDTIFAGNLPYLHKKRYKITVIDRNPDSILPDKIGQLPLCLHDMHFTVDNLNHDVYNIYF